MRPLIVCCFSICLISFTWTYIWFANQATPELVNISEVAATGKYDLHLTIPFASSPSLFSGVDEAESVSVRFRGERIYSRTTPLQAGATLILKDVPGVKSGDNEFFVFVSAGDESDALGGSGFGSEFSLDQPVPESQADSESESSGGLAVEVQEDGQEKAIRVSIFEQGQDVPAATQTIWSSNSTTIEGTIRLRVEPSSAEPETDEHQHL